MSFSSLTCRCRFCGYVLSYSRDDVGMDARCPQCTQTIRLPGKLDRVATIKTVRRRNPTAMAFEAAGFLCMFFYFPWGLLVGCPLVYFGWRRATVRICSSCNNLVSGAEPASCRNCGAKFGAD